MPHPKYPDIKVVMIAAVDRNGALGNAGALPWKCPVDMRHFVACTTGKVVVMGRKTADGFARPLRNRMNIVMTRSGVYERAGFHAAATIEDALEYAQADGRSEIWIIGGGVVYAAWLDYADLIHLTEIDIEVPEADTWFPCDGMSAFQGTSVTTVEDPLVRFWTMQRSQVGTRRNMIADQATAVVMDLNQPVAMWTVDKGHQDFDDFLQDLDT